MVKRFRRVSRAGAERVETIVEIEFTGPLPADHPDCTHFEHRFHRDGVKVRYHGTHLPDDMPNPEPEIPDLKTGKYPSKMTDEELTAFCARTDPDQPLVLKQLLLQQIAENEMKIQRLLDKAQAQAVSATAVAPAPHPLEALAQSIAEPPTE